MNYRQWKKKRKKEHGSSQRTEERKAAQIICAKELQVMVQKIKEAFARITQKIKEAFEKIEKIEAYGYCEAPDCKHCFFPPCSKEIVDMSIKKAQEKEKKENEQRNT